MTDDSDRDSGWTLHPVKFSRLSTRGLLLGLTGPQLGCLAAGLVAFVAGLYSAGSLGLVVTSPVWIIAAGLGSVQIGGRTLISWTPIVARWIHRSRQGHIMSLHNPFASRIDGTLALPGVGPLRYITDRASGAVMVEDRMGQTLTAVVEVTYPSFVLLDPGEQERRVAGWGRVLATCCRSGRIARVQICERAIPDSGKDLANWWAQHGHDDAPTAGIYRELIAQAGPASERHVATVSVALDMRAARRAIRAAGGGTSGACAVLRQEMATLTDALRTAELAPAGWLDETDLAQIIRTAYDPATPRRTAGQPLSDAIPMGFDEHWSALRTDSGWHATLWISQWPQARVFPGFLAPLVLTSGVRRTFSLTVTPLRADVAARDIRRKKTEYVADAAQRAKIGQITDATQTSEYRDILQQEADMAAGHGLCRYTGLVTLSAPTKDQLQAAIVTIEQAAIQASCETRALPGQQAAAFTVAALPLCQAL